MLTTGDGPAEVLAGVGDGSGGMALRALPARLPAGVYALTPAPRVRQPAASRWPGRSGAYPFDRYRKTPAEPRARLVAADGVDLAEVRAVAHACALARDLINTPGQRHGPAADWRWSRARWPRRSAPRSRWSSATRCWRRTIRRSMPSAAPPIPPARRG